MGDCLYKRRTVFLVLIPRWIKIRFLEVELDFIAGCTEGSAVIFMLQLTCFVEIFVSTVKRYKSKKDRILQKGSEIVNVYNAHLTCASGRRN